MKCRVADAMLHRWEEPPISGARGSGAVFFAGCALRCEFCQNIKISRSASRFPEYGERALAALFLELQGKGAENINLVTPSHYARITAEALRIARDGGLTIPAVYNCGGYEKHVETFAGLVDIWLPDLKFSNDETAAKYTRVRDYFTVASRALTIMRDMPDTETIVRHLCLPGELKDTFRVLEWLAENLPGVKISLMNQFTPNGHGSLTRKLTTFEYEKALERCRSLGVEGYFQGKGAADAKFIPDFP